MKINTKFLISILVILILLSLIIEFSKIIENNTNKDNDEKEELKDKGAEDLVLLNKLNK